MRTVNALCIVLSLTVLPYASLAQELTTAQVLARLDEKAKVFTSLESSISQAQESDGLKFPVESGKIYMKLSKGIPIVLLDITTPKKMAKTALVKDGKYTVFTREQNSYREGVVDPKSNAFQLLLTGFGVTSDTLKKFYNPQLTGRETIDGVATAALDLTPLPTGPGTYKKITLWVDTKTWVPVQIRLTGKANETTDFKYSNISLNKGISDSVFKLNIPKGAVKQ